MKLNTKKLSIQFIAVAALSVCLISTASAGTTGAEFQQLYDWINGVVTGYGGKAAAMASIGIGALFSIGRSSPFPILGGVAFAIFLQYVPTIVTGILTATI